MLTVSSLILITISCLSLSMLWWKTYQLRQLHRKIDDLRHQDNKKTASSNSQDQSRRSQIATLQSSESHLQAIINSAADGIVTFNAEGFIVTYNPACTEIFDYQGEEMLSLPIRNLIPSLSQSVKNQLLAYLNPSDIVPMRHESEGYRKNGSRFPLEYILSEFDLDNQRFYTCIIRDVTDRKQLEKMLQNSIQQLQSTVEKRTHDVKKLSEMLDIQKQLIDWPQNNVTAQLNGVGQLRNRDTATFKKFSKIYCELLEDYLKAMSFKNPPARSSIITFTNRLGDYAGGPKDILDLHLDCIEKKSHDRQVSSKRLQHYTLEGRLLVIEVMGHLVDYYRLRKQASRESSKNSASPISETGNN